ncbi:wax ester/triacylglycerol synthase family O-acyltransferase [Nocardioides coralli]|uniref:wax ester/triacylglycerol synthase family O-acyltransferase n=1 Tax=Nocardioides coralli TaxID=2872154 RepID=UPI001CA3A40D|nr:wax ester/triacylglycerol synthase family O-acyltransferase [Nocardioides coralli]QZY28409.1 wax ester/triacylglycerol synthase family O-acyltransferase [Nocardioides coralli]
MREHRVNPVDAIWLNMDRPQNLMVIECVLFLEGPVDRERLHRVIQRRLVDAYPVFSRRPTTPRHRWSRARWQDVPDLDVAAHIREARLPAPGDSAALQEYVAGFFGTPLPRDRPLWEIHLVEGLAEGTAIYVRLHHALADGIALTQVLLSLTDAAADADVDAADEGGARHHGVGELIQVARRVVPEVPGLVRPSRVRAGVVAAIRTALSGLGVVRKLLLTRNPESSLAGAAGERKRAVWSDPVDLQLVKDIARASDATVNDVLVSALAGSLERYQLSHEGRTRDIPTMIPVNLRPAHVPLPRELGNRFTLVLLLLPSGLTDATERLAETKRRMDEIKRSPEPVITFALILGIGRLGRRLSRLLVTFFAGKASGVTTNVPGPREHRYLAGTRITSLLGWVPGSADQALGTCIFTYAGTVRVGFKTDSRVIPDPERVLDAFHAEIEELSRDLVASAR